jgi:hypothetical protein
VQNSSLTVGRFGREFFFPLLDRRAELVHAEDASSFSGAFLAYEDRSGRFESDGYGNNRHQREEKGSQKRADDQIEDSLDRTLRVRKNRLRRADQRGGLGMTYADSIS